MFFFFRLRPDLYRNAKMNTDSSSRRCTILHSPGPSRLAKPAKKESSRTLFRFWCEMHRQGRAPFPVGSAHASARVSTRAGRADASKATSQLERPGREVRDSEKGSNFYRLGVP